MASNPSPGDSTSGSETQRARVIPITEVAADEGGLYAARKKIQPRSIKGRFNTVRWAMVWITQAGVLRTGLAALE